MPSRADVSPADIVSHLPSVFLIGVDQPAVAPPDFNVRLMGTALNDLFARDFTGRTFDQGLSPQGAVLEPASARLQVGGLGLVNAGAFTGFPAGAIGWRAEPGDLA